ncbi:golgin subfamily B member 1 isoform X2 [Rhinatrema bivittatum]|uniref:golgin subfamily B member 1 isoform X2 n=1 Tax=Rhinatrema bivittatum TaxID=194408 RepID=UPI00112DCDB3|nr:golgin subfamily B member 1 isoform X2 [Rhinatrema bivittatum]
MLSRLSGIANTVLHELSGDGDAEETESADPAPMSDPGMEKNNMAAEDVLERLAHTEQLVVQMKELIREKDAQLQQKEVALKEEKDLADAKLAKLKLQAKAKMVSLNKQIEELKQAATGSPGKPPLSGEHSFQQEQHEELEALKLHLQEKDASCKDLQEMVAGLKEQLEATKQTLKQSVAQHTEQLSSLQQVIQEKDIRFQEQVHHHEEELLQVAAQSKAGAEMQQALRTLQRKEEEQEEALLARARVVEMLQQELENADQQKQILSQQFREMEAEVSSLKVELDTERKTSRTMVEKSEAEMKAKERFLHQMEDEVQTLKEQLEEAKKVCANMDSERNIQNQKYGEEVQSLKEQLEEARRVHTELESEKNIQEQKHGQEVQSIREQLEEARRISANVEPERNASENHGEEMQSLKKQLEEARRVHTELESEKNIQEQKHGQEVQSLREQLEEARRISANVEPERNACENHGEEMQSLREQLEEERRVKADLELELNIQDQKHRDDMQSLKEQLQEARRVCANAESEKNIQERNNEEEQLEEGISTKLERERNAQTVLGQTVVVLEEKESASQLVSEPEVTLLQRRVMELEEEKTRWTVHMADLEEVKAENETLNSRLALLEAQCKGTGAAEDLLQISTDVSVQCCETSRPGLEDNLLENTTAFRTKELSILMLDLHDAQEEIAKLKEQLLDREGRWIETEVESRAESQMAGVANQQGVDIEIKADAMVYTGIRSVVETTIEKEASLLLTEKGITLVDVEVPVSTVFEEEQTGTFLPEQVLHTSERRESRQGIAEETTVTAEELSTPQTQEHQRLQKQIPDLQNADSEKETDTYQLNKSILECQISEDSTSVLHEITKEVSHISLRDTCTVADLKEQLRKLKDDMSDVEKQRMSDYENMSMQHSMQGEQITSLENESKSKDLKIKALQKDLDQIQLQFSEQETLIKHLKNHLKEKENEVLDSEERLRESFIKVEELAQKIDSKELETARMEQLLFEKTQAMESLKQSLLEKDQQAAEISHSMSERMVQLNEEKHTLRGEIKSLKEHISSLQNNEEMKENEMEIFGERECSFDQKELLQHKEMKEIMKKGGDPQAEIELQKQLQQNREMMEIKEKEALLDELEATRHSQLQHDKHMATLQKEKEELQDQLDAMKHAQYQQQGEVSEILLAEKEELQSLLEHQKKENEQVKRKLQAALINRKELMKKVDKLERELVQFQRESGENMSTRGDGKEEDCYRPTELHIEGDETSESQEMEISLHHLSEKDLELPKNKKDIAEKAASEEQLQALIKEMTLDLQGKADLIKSLEVEVMENQSIIRKLTISDQSSEDASLISTKDPVSIGHESTTEEQQWMVVQCRISSLEQEKEQLQKKVQEALTSRKDTIKKAQEKDRHHREQLKQQKEDYNLLQEKFDEQNRNQVSIQEQLQELQRELEKYKDSQATLNGAHETIVSLQSSFEQVSSITSLPQISSQDSGWGQEWVEVSSSEIEDTLKDNFLQIKDMSEELPREHMEKLQAKREELELKVNSVEKDLALKSEEVLHLQEHITKLDSEVEDLKMKYDKAEANASSLKLQLEHSQAEILSQVDLKDLKPQVEELKSLVGIKSEAAELLSIQLREKNDAFANMQKVVLEKEESITDLQTQLESQAKEHEEKTKMFQTKVLELQQKQEEEAEEMKSNQQIQRKLQAALISRKEALKESKSLKEDLAAARITIDSLTNKLTNMESSMSDLTTQNDKLLNNTTVLKEEREKLIVEIDKALMENQNLNASCQSLKIALETITQERENLEKERESLRKSQDTERLECQDKYKDLQKEYEILLQSYENVSNETERMQRVMETVRQEKQELFTKIKNVEAEKKAVEKQLQEMELEIEGMKEKMRKFAKSKQQKILELEEENERLRTESQQAEAEDGAPSEKPKLEEELERVKSEYESLLHQLVASKTERESLAQEIKDLKHQLQSMESKLKGSLDTAEKKQIVQEEVMVEVKQVSSIEAAPEMVVEEQIHREDNLESSDPKKVQEELKSTECSSHDEINTYIQQVNQLKEQISELKKKEKSMDEEVSIIKSNFQKMEEEKSALQHQITTKCDELKVLQEAISEMELNNKHAKDELVKMTRLKETLEAEKDDLEERLMNQLAELNGSIGNYQQDATDFQTKNDSLELELQSLQRKICNLEEENRQLVREKTEVESKIQREYSVKLKSSQKEEKGRKAHTKELQELLKEKQQEVKQLQKDCIRYQEKITGLERTVKALEFVQSESLKEQEAAKERQAKAIEDSKKAQAELASFRVILDDTQSEAARVLADSLKLKEELQAHKENVSSQMKKKDKELEKKIEQEKNKHVKEMKNKQEKLEFVQREKDHMEGTIKDLQDSLDIKNQEAAQLQGSLNENLAKLAAFTRSMSSLQDDRDRIMDDSKKWEKKFTEAIQKKEEEIKAKEEMCIVLKDQMKQMSIHIEELCIKVSRLEHEKQDWESKLKTQSQNHQMALETLHEEIQGLHSQLSESQKLHSNCQNDLRKLAEKDKEVRDQLEEITVSYSKSEMMREEKEKTVKEQDAQLQDYKFSCEQLQADLLASKELTNKLHEEIEAKDQRIISLLAAKEEAVAAALLELQQQNAGEVKELEDRLKEKEQERGVLETDREKLQGRLTGLIAKMKNMKEESKQLKASLDSFTKSMSSLQDDRDRVLAEYKQLEERHLNVSLDKDQLIQEAAAENNTLKEEIRGLHSRMDDMNSENAKLAAELVRYREDLNHVITLKDSQQKHLLKVQLEQIHVLEDEKANVEGQLRDSQTVLEDLKQTVDVLQNDKQKMAEEIENLKLCISQLTSDVMSLKEGGEVLELEAQSKEKDENIQRLNNNISLLQKRVKELEEEMIHVKEEAAEKVQVVKGKHKVELQSLQHDAGIMRNETETAEERVAELARDLMIMEQRLLLINEENTDLKAQIKSFGKSMSSLQDSRDQAQEDLSELKKNHLADLEIQDSMMQNLQKELVQLKEEHSSVVKERDSLSTDLMNLRSSFVKDSLSSQVEQLSQQLQSRDQEITHLTLKLEASSTQLQSFSKAMASLQDERDRLLGELGETKKLEDKKQQSVAASPAQVQSLKNALSSLQNDRGRLLNELKNLQQQYLQIGEETSDITQLKAQLQLCQQQVENEQRFHEQLQLDNTCQQQELQQLREEKAHWESQGETLKEQYLTALADKDQHLRDLQRLLHEMKSHSSKPKVTNEQYQRQSSPETASYMNAQQGDLKILEAEAEHLRSQLGDSLHQLHQKELRIQQLNSKLSHIYEEKNSLAIQLRGSSQNLRESNQRYNEVLTHCATLERQLQELQPQHKEDMVTVLRDTAPGAPQEKKEPQAESCPMELKELQLRSESSEWAHDHSPDMSSSHEHSLLIEPMESTLSKTRSSSGLRRFLQYMFYSRTRTPLLLAVYFLTVHILLFLCFTGHL